MSELHQSGQAGIHLTEFQEGAVRAAVVAELMSWFPNVGSPDAPVLFESEAQMIANGIVHRVRFPDYGKVQQTDVLSHAQE